METKPEPTPMWAVFTPAELDILLGCATGQLARSEPFMLKRDVKDLKAAIAKLEEARKRPSETP